MCSDYSKSTLFTSGHLRVFVVVSCGRVSSGQAHSTPLAALLTLVDWHCRRIHNRRRRDRRRRWRLRPGISLRRVGVPRGNSRRGRNGRRKHTVSELTVDAGKRTVCMYCAAGRCSLSGQAAYASWAQHDARRTTSLLRQISRRGAIEAATPRQFAAVRCQAVLVLAASIPCHVRVEAVPACLLSHWKLA